ncbi:MAG TPA: hypothetical protein PLQ11_01320 [Beijerinckiaceae bacterium]|nr:hypothetical protein [Beijerinckiaceae bacterium]
MTPVKKLAAVAIASLTLATTFATSAEAQYRRHGWGPRPGPVYVNRHRGFRGAPLAAGLLGSAVIGSMLMATRPAYAAPVYQDECYREYVGRDRYGRRLYQTVCY